MKCRIEQDWARDAVRVWFYDPRPEGFILRRLVGPDTWQDEVVDPGDTVPEPSLVLHREALDSLVRAASGILPPTDATTRHLEDTVAVRDRLLALIEARS